MKKVYLLASAFLLGGAAFGQHTQFNGAVSPFMKAAKKSQTETYFGKGDVQNGDARGGAFWTEDFSNGLASTNGPWAQGGTNGNIWKHSMNGPSGCFSANTPTPAFTTVADGFMLFDADSANCIDATSNPPTFNQNAYVGSITSSAIDCSSEPNVNVMFEHTYRYCCFTDLELWLDVSTDSTNWTSYDVSESGDATNDNASNPVTTSVNITSVAGGQSTVYIRFRWETNNTHYYWALDDVNMIPSPDHEVAMLSAFWGSNDADSIPYTMVPTTQAQDFLSWAEISNQGANIENVSITADVSGAATLLSGNSTMSPITVNPAMSAADGFASWNSGSTVGAYTQTYSFDYPDLGMDDDTSNNSITYPFWVTDYRYGRDADVYTGSGLWNGEDASMNSNPFTMGPLMVMQNAATVYSLEIALTGNTDPGVLVYPEIYEVDMTGNFNVVYSGASTADERTITSADISASPSITTVKLNINGGTGAGGFALNAGTQYLFTVGHYGGPDALVIMNGSIAAPPQTIFLYDPTATTGGPWFFMTSTPLIRAVFDPEGVGVEEEASNISLGQNMPNPFDGTSRINFSLENAADVTMEITDVTGKVVKTFDKGTLSSGQHFVELNANDFAGGIYNYTIKADGQTATKRMIITK